METNEVDLNRDDEEGSCLDDLSTASLTDNEEEISGKKEKNKPKKNIVNTENTVFVGNLPNTIDKKQLKKLFVSCGKIVSVRLRCAVRKELKTPKKLAIIKKDFHEENKSINGFVKFANSDICKEALRVNGKCYKGHHLRVSLADKKLSSNTKKSIFVGNLPFKIQDDELWEPFEVCGPIESVRVIRDSNTGIGKGFGYVNFKSADSVELALTLNGMQILDREVRISRSSNDPSDNQKKPKRKKINLYKDKKQLSTPKQKQSHVDKSSNVSKSKKDFQGKKTKPSLHKKGKKKKKFDKKAMVIKQIAEGMKKKDV